MNYIFFFLLYAHIGWVIEVLFYFLKEKKYVNRGFLFLPFVPLYGFGIVFFLAFISFFPTLEVLTLTTFVISFLVILFISSLIEYITGVLLMFFFKTRWWDYSNQKYNLKGYISLGFSLIWGFFGTIFYYLFHINITKNILDFLYNFDFFYYFLFIVFLIVFIDFVWSVFKALEFSFMLSEFKYKIEKTNFAKNFYYIKGNSYAIENFRKVITNFTNKKDQIKNNIIEKRALEKAIDKIKNKRYYRVFPSLKIKMNNKDDIDNKRK